MKDKGESTCIEEWGEGLGWVEVAENDQILERNGTLVIIYTFYLILSKEERNLNYREGNREEDGTTRGQIFSKSYFICVRMIMTYRNDMDS